MVVSPSYTGASPCARLYTPYGGVRLFPILYHQRTTIHLQYIPPLLGHGDGASVVAAIDDIAAAVGDVELDVEKRTVFCQEAVDDGRLLSHLALEAFAVAVLQESSSGGKGRQGCEDEGEDEASFHLVKVKGYRLKVKEVSRFRIQDSSLEG